MKSPAELHTLKIARQTLKYSIAAARVLGGMSYGRAYRIVFGIGLADRIRDLQARYTPAADLSWELGQYGYTPADFPALLAEGEREARDRA